MPTSSVAGRSPALAVFGPGALPAQSCIEVGAFSGDGECVDILLPNS